MTQDSDSSSEDPNTVYYCEKDTSLEATMLLQDSREKPLVPVNSV